MGERQYGATAFVLPEHFVRHLAESAQNAGITMQAALERHLCISHRQWCNECWGIFADAATKPKGGDADAA